MLTTSTDGDPAAFSVLIQMVPLPPKQTEHQRQPLAEQKIVPTHFSPSYNSKEPWFRLSPFTCSKGCWGMTLHSVPETSSIGSFLSWSRVVLSFRQGSRPLVLILCNRTPGEDLCRFFDASSSLTGTAKSRSLHPGIRTAQPRIDSVPLANGLHVKRIVWKDDGGMEVCISPVSQATPDVLHPQDVSP